VAEEAEEEEEVGSAAVLPEVGLDKLNLVYPEIESVWLVSTLEPGNVGDFLVSNFGFSNGSTCAATSRKRRRRRAAAAAIDGGSDGGEGRERGGALHVESS
jgi:hypothetical protein